MYANHIFYLNDYRGTAATDEETFARLSVLAAAHINRITFNRAKTAEGSELEAVKFALCAVVDELIRQESGGIVTSESNDGLSRSFAVGSVVKSQTQRINEVAELFLNSTNLMFAGV